MSEQNSSKEENNYNYVAVEQKWQNKWFDANIHVAQKRKLKKFFLLGTFM